jgi:hypothetical protein
MIHGLNSTLDRERSNEIVPSLSSPSRCILMTMSSSSKRLDFDPVALLCFHPIIYLQPPTILQPHEMKEPPSICQRLPSSWDLNHRPPTSLTRVAQTWLVELHFYLLCLVQNVTIFSASTLNCWSERRRDFFTFPCSMGKSSCVYVTGGA